MKILLENIKVFAHHGWYNAEREMGHWFVVNVVLEINQENNINDDLNNTFNYEKAYEIVVSEMSSTQKLLETVVDNMMKKLNAFEIINSISIRISKLDPHLMPGVEKVSIEKLLKK